jgi:hypothetical protein
MHALSNRLADGTQAIYENRRLPNGAPTPLIEKCGDVR